MAATLVQPSPFAVLLRRSRFATYDPAIGQVYTSGDGDAHRGNYGFKRPFPLRRRHGFVTVHSVDSNEQQTEFNRAETRARFIARFEEVGGPVDARESNWSKKAGNGPPLVDSEFAPLARSQELRAKDAQERELARIRSGQIPRNTTVAAPKVEADESDKTKDVWKASSPDSVKLLSAMSPRQFERYLAQLRSIRPQFQKYVHKNASTRNITDLSPHALATNPNNIHRDFIASYTDKWLRSGGARSFAQAPHHNGALYYPHTSQLQNLFYTQPQPGIALMNNFSKSGDRTTRSGAQHVSFAGLTTMLKSSQSKVPVLDTTTGVNLATVDRSVGLFRMSHKPKLLQVPNVVGRTKQGTNAARVEAEVYLDEAPDFGEKVYPPGTREAVAPPFDPDTQRPYLFGATSLPQENSWRRPGRKDGEPGPEDFLNVMTDIALEPTH